MSTETLLQTPIEIVEIRRKVDIAASLDIAFAAMLDELGPDAEMMDGTPKPLEMKA